MSISGVYLTLLKAHLFSASPENLGRSIDRSIVTSIVAADGETEASKLTRESRWMNRFTSENAILAVSEE